MHPFERAARLIGVALLLFFLPATLPAQPPQTGPGTIRLEVKDASGAAMSQVDAQLHGVSGRFDRTLRSDDHGVIEFTGVPLGRYHLELSKNGFASQSIDVEVRAQHNVTRTITLAIAAQVATVEVVAATPLPGTDLPIDQIAAPVQTATAGDIQKSGAIDLSKYMMERMDGVHINENQENPFQPDLNYRGYTASPLLGTPEGISVYLDGVRQNQPFGDVMAWDLIPKVAIDEMALMPGSNPLFGLNTLGGAVSVQMKDGRTSPGTMLEVSAGSFGRRQGQFEHGGSHKVWSWYLGGNLFREDGWRQFSTSEVRQEFAKIGWQRGKTQVTLSFGYADNWLTGNGLQDFRFLQQHYASVYSIPDITWNRSPSLILNVRRDVTQHLTLSGNGYFRYIRADTTNGDISDVSFDQSIYDLSAADVAALTAAGYKGFPTTGNAASEPFPFWRCIAQGLEQNEPIEKCTGIITNTFDKQHNEGLSGQASWSDRRNHFTAGGAWDHSSLTFQQGSQFGYLNPDRLTITPINAFADGSTTQDDVPVDTRVNLRGVINTFGFYATDTITAGKFALTFSGRYNRTTIDNFDRLPPVGDGSRGSLTSNNLFERFNPAVGATYNAFRGTTLYFSYSEASRAPTAIELGCSDPNDPCNLPNALVGDPPLKQVVTRTLEAGVRGNLETRLRWSVGWFRGINHNDLLFVASEQTGFGYFTNFGQTERQGMQADLNATWRKIVFGGGYTFLSATYESPQVVGGGSNSSNDGGAGLDGNIAIQPGDQIPQIPRNIFKAYVDYTPTAKLGIDLDFDAVGRSFARGNENNLDRPDGVFYLGQGYSPGYGVVNLGAHYQIEKRVQLFLQIDNLLNHRYYTAAQLGPSPYDNNGNFIARPFSVNGDFPIRNTTFFAPGAPIGAWGGIRFRF